MSNSPCRSAMQASLFNCFFSVLCPAKMDDPFLRAWTTQYTNSPITSSLPTTRGELRSCSLREKCVGEKRQPPKYARTPPYTSMPHAVSCEPREGICNLSSGNGAPEYIDPSLLLLPGQQVRPEIDNHPDARLPGQELGTRYPYTRPNTPDKEASLNAPESNTLSPQREQNAREKQYSPSGDIFEGILAKMQAFDVVRPQSADGVGNGESLQDVETKQTDVRHGFAINVGWSSTFFPDYIQEGCGYSRTIVAADTIGHS
ncbi:hypothetical protein BDW71DRAFT_181871 [Aspergillus fruticulosus]